MSKSFFFYGVTDSDEDIDPMWKILHDHFEKLAREDDGRNEEVFEGKATKRK